MIDDGQAIHYASVARGTPVYASDETQVGTVDQVADNYREHILDGFVIITNAGDVRFVRRARGGTDRRAWRDPLDHAHRGRAIAAARAWCRVLYRQCPYEPSRPAFRTVVETRLAAFRGG